MTSPTRVLLILAMTASTIVAEDWPRFRGPAGSGVAASGSVPAAWSPKANIAWKAPLPGPGASSPIIVGDRAFVTCYSGYGLDQEAPGELGNLVRHLVCIDMNTGDKLWQQDVESEGPEDPFTGAGVPAHGYASHTPVSDGKNVYAFFGKSGVHAYDLDGNKLWDAEVGKESDPTKWGSSSSPIVFEDTVIVTASAESQAIIGFDKKSGKELWRQECEGLDSMWGTPTLVEVDDDRTDLVMCVAKELWGLDPNSGKLRWFADALGSRHSYTSVVFDGKRVFAFTGSDGGSVAVDAGGSGDVSKTNTAWTGRTSASFGSPVRHKGMLYVVSDNVVSQVNAETGERTNQMRLKNVMRATGRFGALDYPSPIVIGDSMYYLNSRGQMFVLSLGDELKQVAVNRVTKDAEVFRGTPAVSKGRIVLRSSDHLYCVADKGESVNPDDNKLASTERAAPPSQNRRGNRRDPMAIFNDLDKDKDEKVSFAELAGNRMEGFMKPMDKDGDEAISKDEFNAALAEMRSRQGGGYGGEKDTRPDRPQRPEPADK